MSIPHYVLDRSPYSTPVEYYEMPLSVEYLHPLLSKRVTMKGWDGKGDSRGDSAFNRLYYTSFFHIIGGYKGRNDETNY